MYIGRYIFLHNYRFVSPVPQDVGFLDPNLDLQNMRIHGAKYQPKTAKKMLLSKPKSELLKKNEMTKIS